MFFDLSGQIDVPTVVGEHGGMGNAEGALVSACRDVEQVDIRLKLLGNAYSLIQTVALLYKLRAGQTELDGEKGADGFPDALQNFNGEAAAVFQRAAIFVGAHVEHRGQKLDDEPAVAAVDHQQLKARPLGKSGDMAVGSNDFANHAAGQFTHLNPVRADRGRRTPPGHAVLLVFISHVGAGVHPGMGQLQAGHGPMPTDGVSGIGGAGQRVQNALVQMIGVGAVGLGMNHTLRHGDRRRAALGPQLIEGGGFGANTAVVGDISAAHGSGKHPVAEGGAAQGNGRAKVGVFTFHSLIFLLLCKGAGHCNLCRFDLRHNGLLLIDLPDNQISSPI